MMENFSLSKIPTHHQNIFALVSGQTMYKIYCNEDILIVVLIPLLFLIFNHIDKLLV